MSLAMESQKNGPIPSGGWTGDPVPSPSEGKFEKWTDDHPLVVAAIYIVVVSLLAVLRLDHLSAAVAAIVFVVSLAVNALVLGSIVGGAWLFLWAVGKIAPGAADALSKGQKAYVGVLLALGAMLSLAIGPFLLVKLFALIGGAA